MLPVPRWSFNFTISCLNSCYPRQKYFKECFSFLHCSQHIEGGVIFLLVSTVSTPWAIVVRTIYWTVHYLSAMEKLKNICTFLHVTTATSHIWDKYRALVCFWTLSLLRSLAFQPHESHGELAFPLDYCILTPFLFLSFRLLIHLRT